MRRTAYLGCSLLLTAALALPAVAGPQAPVENDATAYTNYYNENDTQTKADLGEKFFTQFKASQYANPVFSQTVDNYAKLSNWSKVLELVAKGDQLFPEMAANNKARMYAQGMTAANQRNNGAQVIAFGDKVLGIAPEDLNTLITLASVIPSLSPNDNAALVKAEGYATKALTVVAKFDPAANGLSAAEWAKQRPGIEGTLHSTIGTIAYNKADYEKAIEELTQTAKMTPKDGSAWYLLGVSQAQISQTAGKLYLTAVNDSNALVKSKAESFLIEESKAKADALGEDARAKRDVAIETLATAVACGGTSQQPAMTQLRSLFTTKNGSADGLDALVTTKKAWLQTLP